uniref:FBA_2 domain-containing protein n=1 Tax=Caenorhabditis tropicalis TaxID=1561998 RepID=A0A1I7T1H3_9PELO
MTSSPLHLLRLPILNTIQIFDSMEIIDQFIISFCSKKTLLIVKDHCNKRVSLRVHLGKHVETQLFGQPYRGLTGVTVHPNPSEIGEEVKIKERTISVKMVEMEDGQRILMTYYKDRSFHLALHIAALVEYLCELFHGVIDIPMDRLTINNENQWISDVNLEKILWSVECRHLIMDLESNTFRLNDFYKSIDIFESHRANWISIDNLITIDSMHIKVTGTNFTNLQINRFLKYWNRNVGSFRLKFFAVRVDDFNENVAFQGIDLYLVNADTRYYTAPDGTIYKFGNREIHRRDDSTASIIYWEQLRLFGLAVWPDANGISNYLDAVQQIFPRFVWR